MSSELSPRTLNIYICTRADNGQRMDYRFAEYLDGLFKQIGSEVFHEGIKLKTQILSDRTISSVDEDVCRIHDKEVKGPRKRGAQTKGAKNLFLTVSPEDPGSIMTLGSLKGTVDSEDRSTTLHHLFTSGENGDTRIVSEESLNLLTDNDTESGALSVGFFNRIPILQESYDQVEAFVRKLLTKIAYDFTFNIGKSSGARESIYREHPEGKVKGGRALDAMAS